MSTNGKGPITNQMRQELERRYEMVQYFERCVIVSSFSSNRFFMAAKANSKLPRHSGKSVSLLDFQRVIKKVILKINWSVHYRNQIIEKFFTCSRSSYRTYRIHP